MNSLTLLWTRDNKERFKFDLIKSKLNYKFNDEYLLMEALTHRSAVGDYLLSMSMPLVKNEWHKHKWNERLEFIGDSILNLVTTEYLYKKHPNKQEGELPHLKHFIVSNSNLMEVGDKLNIADHLMALVIVGSMKADAVEAIIGAIYLDGGLNSAREFIVNNIDLDAIPGRDYKTEL